MLSKLKDLRFILIVLLILSWIAAGVFFFMQKNHVEEQLAAKDADIEALNASLSDIGELVPAYVVSADVPSGKEIEESDLEEIDVPLSMSTNLVQDASEIIGKHFKLDMTAGTVITGDSVYEEVITSDMRYYDLIVDVVPIGLQPGSFVDIRIKFGTGADFVGISHRQVVQVNGNALKLILTEEDIHMYSSMLVDNIVFNQDFQSDKDLNGDGKINSSDKVTAIGAYIYAVEYVLGGVQDKAGEFYSPSALVQGIMTSDPNILESNLSPNDLVLKRKLIEAGLEGTTDTAKKIREEVSEAIEDGRKIYEKNLEKELEEAEKAAEQG